MSENSYDGKSVSKSVAQYATLLFLIKGWVPERSDAGRFSPRTLTTDSSLDSVDVRPRGPDGSTRRVHDALRCSG